MKGKLKSYAIIIVYLIIGLIVIGISQLIKPPSWLNSTFIVLSLLVIVNIVTVKIFHLNNDVKEFWSIKKIYFLPIGIGIGVLIATAPVLVGLIVGKIVLDETAWSASFAITSIVTTLAIVTWEELWFRGIFLNYCSKKISPIHISITIGLLFSLVHLLNPEINFIKTGPTLFFAGAFLTIVYFYFETIWLPIGLHFGNNYFSLESNLQNHWFLGNEGCLSTLILAAVFLLFVRLMHNNKLA